MKDPVVHINNLNQKYGSQTLFCDLCWTILAGENWLLTGPSGSGKTTLAKAILHASKGSGSIAVNIENRSDSKPACYFVENWYAFKDLEGQSNFYYQQRYQQHSATHTQRVAQELNDFGRKYQLNAVDLNQIIAKLDFEKLVQAKMIELSSGEHKKLQLIMALWLQSPLIILDLPYNGLDAHSRQSLNQLIDEVARKGSQIILIANTEELPQCINRYANIINSKIVETPNFSHSTAKSILGSSKLPRFFVEKNWVNPSSHIIKMINVNITYGDKKILTDINWEVKPGERWLLSGHNGSGKSTLLSLVCADHPQSFANDLYLFGRKRGTGESIWEIKERIGLISPELHWYFEPKATVWQTTLSGLYDTNGLFCEPGFSNSEKANELIDVFGLKDDKNKAMEQLPLGKQRLALLARSTIKNPELLVLDEPCQGLDEAQTAHFNELIDSMAYNGTTIIYVGHYESKLPACITHSLTLKDGKIESINKSLKPVSLASH